MCWTSVQLQYFNYTDFQTSEFTSSQPYIILKRLFSRCGAGTYTHPIISTRSLDENFTPTNEGISFDAAFKKSSTLAEIKSWVDIKIKAQNRLNLMWHTRVYSGIFISDMKNVLSCACVILTMFKSVSSNIKWLCKLSQPIPRCAIVTASVVGRSLNRHCLLW